MTEKKNLKDTPSKTKKTISVASRKAKGRNLQKYVVDTLRALFNLADDDITSRSMGAAGEDILLSPTAREVFPFSVECKNVESLNFWNAWKQAKDNSRGYNPVVIVKRNHHEPLALISAETFFNLVHNQVK